MKTIPWKKLICKFLKHKLVGDGWTTYVWCSRCDEFLGKIDPKKNVLWVR